MTEGIPPPSTPKDETREEKKLEAERAAIAREIAERAIAEGKQQQFLHELYRFPDTLRFPKDVIRPLMEYARSTNQLHLFWSITENLHLFTGLDNETAAFMLRMDAGFAQSYFRDTPQQSVLRDAFSKRDERASRPSFSFFPPPSIEVAEALLDAGQAWTLAQNMDRFAPEVHPAIVESVWKRDPEQFKGGFPKFPYHGIKRIPPGFAEKVVAENMYDAPLLWLQDGVIPKEEVGAVVERLIPTVSSMVYETFQLADIVVAKAGEGVITQEQVDQALPLLFASMRNAFLNDTTGTYFSAYHTPKLLRYNRLLPLEKRDEVLEELAREFGEDNVTGTLYASYELAKGGAYQGPLIGTPKNNSPIGILRGEIEALRPIMLSGEPDARVLASPLHRELFKMLVRFGESSFGEHGADAFAKTVQKYEELKREGSLEPLDPAFAPFELSVPMVREGKTVYTEDFLARWETLIDDIRFAGNVVRGEKKPLSFLAKRVRESRSQALLQLDSLVKKAEQENENPKKIENLKKQVALVESVNIRDLKDIEHTLTTLARVRQAPGIESLFRSVAFAYTFMRYPNELGKDYAGLGADGKPSRADITQVLEFVDHLTNDEVWKGQKEGGTRRGIIQGKKARGALDELLETAALHEQYERFEMLATTDMRTIKVIPQRNLNTELSGHMSDACWASKYDSILKEFPNLTSLTLVQNPGGEFERIAGAALVIDGAAEDGTPLMIVRGINPIENVIQKLDAPTFVRGLLENLQAIAAARGKRLAVVVDNSGEASTNRPAIAEVLNRAAAQTAPSERAKLAESPVTTFNGYDLSQKTWYLDPARIA